MAGRDDPQRGRRTITLVAALVVLCLTGCHGASASHPSSAAAPPSIPSGPPTSAAPTVPSAPSTAGAMARLATLPVRAKGSLAGYSRSQFGPPWADVDHNGCDTRNDILNRDLTQRSWRAGTHDCVVVAGNLADPYSGTQIAFSKAHATAVQIDHVVALGDAWSNGAQAWTAVRREQFANDPLELLAVSGALNEAKGDSDASAWLPPNTAFDCSYVSRQIDVKAAYGLSVTPAEQATMASTLAHCAQPIPTAAPEASTAKASPPRQQSG